MFLAPSVPWSLGGEEGRGRRGATPLHKSYRYVPHQRLWFLCDFNKKERLTCELEIDFTKTFRLRSNLSNDNIISAFARSEKRYRFIEARSQNRCENCNFWSEIGSGFGEQGGTPPPTIPRSTSPVCGVRPRSNI